MKTSWGPDRVGLEYACRCEIFMSKHECIIIDFMGETTSYSLLLKAIGLPQQKVHTCEQPHAGWNVGKVNGNRPCGR